MPLDYPEAYKWYQLAAMRNTSKAKGSLEILLRVMTKRQVEDAKNRVSRWMQSHRSREMNGVSEALALIRPNSD